MMLDEVRFYRKQLGAQEDALRKIKDRERDFLGAMGKINYTKEGLEELVTEPTEKPVVKKLHNTTTCYEFIVGNFFSSMASKPTKTDSLPD